MPGLAGIAFELFAKMVDKGLEYKEESELNVCKQTLRRYKKTYNSLREEYISLKEYSDQIIACHEDTISTLRSQAVELTKSKNELLGKLTASYTRETTGGVASLEEYDEAMKETEDEE